MPACSPSSVVCPGSCARQPEVRRQHASSMIRDQPQLRHDGLAYGVGVLPARVRKPRDKAKVENGVRFAQTCILGRLRRRTFFSLAEANAAIGEALDRINDHVMRRLGVSRRHSSRPWNGLPWRRCRGTPTKPPSGASFVSAPTTMSSSTPSSIPSRTASSGSRSTSAPRPGPSRSSIAARGSRPISAAMAAPPRHRSGPHAQFASSLCRVDSRAVPPLGTPIDQPPKVSSSPFWARPHPEQGFRTCLGVLRLYHDLDKARAEAVAARAVAVRALNYKSIASLLRTTQEPTPRRATPDLRP